MFTLIEEIDRKKVRVRCECGRELIITKHLYKHNLTALRPHENKRLFCGLCRPDGAEDLTGRTFGMLTVIERTVNSPGGWPQWLCKCECGNEVLRISDTLLNGKNPSCGCILPKPEYKYNFRPYRTYMSMLDRCNNPESTAYHNYGGRGIKVCERWQESFDNFWEDMKEGYADDLQIDRIDNNGNYEKENCRWVTQKQNNRNKRTNRYIKTAIGKKIVVEQAEIAGVDAGNVYYKLSRGVPEELSILPRKDVSSKEYSTLKHLYDGDVTIVTKEEAKTIQGIIKKSEIQGQAIRDWGFGPKEIILDEEDDSPVEGLKTADLKNGLVVMKKEDKTQ